ncbi:MAG: hypothetical protein ACREO0_04930, partial [Pseudoxanthomonas sp.]
SLTMKNIFATCIAYTLLAASITAMAQQPSAEQKQALQDRLKAADSNNDGLISKAEADAKLPRVAKKFDKLDANQDGQLSPDEFKAMAAKFAERQR